MSKCSKCRYVIKTMGKIIKKSYCGETRPFKIIELKNNEEVPSWCPENKRKDK